MQLAASAHSVHDLQVCEMCRAGKRLSLNKQVIAKHKRYQERVQPAASAHSIQDLCILAERQKCVQWVRDGSGGVWDSQAHDMLSSARCELVASHQRSP